MSPLALLFFVSGAAGLVYESIWSRELHRIFGTSQFAIATVLAAFMTGLALGGALGARYAPRVARPLRAYAVLEAIIGLFALVFPFLLGGVEPLYLWFWRTFEPGVVAFGTFQFFVLGIVLLLPTACMGATLPLLVRLPADQTGGATAGRLYAINTAGAVFGTWFAGFFLLPDLGVQHTTWLAAATNGLLALLAWRYDELQRREAREAAALGLEPPAPAEAAPARTGSDRRWLFMAAMAGFSALGLEVAWFRLMSLILGASTYAFTVMLLAFLVGIASGGEAAGPLADRLAKRGRLYAGLFGAQVAVAVLTWLAMWGWQWLPITFVKLYFAIRPMADDLLWPAKCLLATAVMAPPAFFMGATFPMLVRAARGSSGASLSKVVGRVYAANTVGSLFGAFLTGFVLLPQLHVRGTVLFCVVLNLFGALLAALSGRAEERALNVRSGPIGNAPVVGSATLVAALLSVAAAPAWDPMLMTTGLYKYVDNLDEDATQAYIVKRFIDKYDLLFYSEGLSTVVTVAKDKVTGNIWLANNGKIDASSTADMPTQLLVAHLAFLFTGEEARSAVVIGLASGITLGAATLHPELERIDVVEIEPSIREATEFFREVNHDALYDPRVRLIANDGRNQLLLTAPGTYDIIICEPSNPWLTGVSNLFTREFFEMAKTRLAPGGIWAQWVQMYGMDGRDMKSVMKTFATVFPYAHTFATIEDADLVMIGSDRPLELDLDAVHALRTRTPGVTADFDRIALRDDADVLSKWLFDRDQMLAFSATDEDDFTHEVTEVPFNTDDNLLVEFSAPHNLHRETSTQNFLELRRAQRIPAFAVPETDGLVELGMAYRDAGQLPRALMALKEALQREPDRPDILQLYEDWQGELRLSIQGG
ncbi:spermidine synthase [Deltaproteobacteria bacterium]|nr:spermidine synthase [Deltaproteobacteria bacterium]